mmetsp:Transcript_37913/g.80999  ORF Transcript_37913/g.80999 Transcript_37913/m.80999 type:complete len:158 (+) Transcript_37913:417-890(+)
MRTPMTTPDGNSKNDGKDGETRRQPCCGRVDVRKIGRRRVEEMEREPSVGGTLRRARTKRWVRKRRCDRTICTTRRSHDESPPTRASSSVRARAGGGAAPPSAKMTSAPTPEREGDDGSDARISGASSPGIFRIGDQWRKIDQNPHPTPSPPRRRCR